MPQGRIVLKAICQSRKLADVKTDGARLLYTWLIPNADVNGCFSGDPEVIKGQIFTRLRKSVKTIQAYLNDLDDTGLILLYESNGDAYLYIINFVKKQPFLNPDREAKSTIPPPTLDQLQTSSGATPLKIERESKRESKDKYTVIFEKWNSYRGKGNWKSHREITYEIKQAIDEQLKHYSEQQICEAIDNYAMVLLGREFQWTYAWTLYQFLTRSRKDNQQEKQLWQFLANNFSEDDYLMPNAKRARVERARRPRSQEPIKVVTPEEKEAIRKKLTQAGKLKFLKGPKPTLDKQEFQQRKDEQVAALTRKLGDKMKG